MSILEQIELKNNWLEDDWSVFGFTVLLISISQSDKGVQTWILTIKICAGQYEKCSNDVHVVEDTVVSLVGDSAWSVDVFGVSQVVPVVFSDPLVQKSASLGEFGSWFISNDDWCGEDDERDWSFFGIGNGFTVDLEFALFVGIDKELTFSELETEVDRVNLNTGIPGFRVSLEPIPKPDKSFNLDLSLTIDPLNDAQESANNISMNGEEEISVFFIESSMIKEVGASEILPPCGFELLVDEGVDVVDGELLGGLYDKVLSGGQGEDQAQEDQKREGCWFEGHAEAVII